MGCGARTFPNYLLAIQWCLHRGFLVAHVDLLVQTWSSLRWEATQTQQQLGRFIVTVEQWLMIAVLIRLFTALCET